MALTVLEHKPKLCCLYLSLGRKQAYCLSCMSLQAIFNLFFENNGSLFTICLSSTRKCSSAMFCRTACLWRTLTSANCDQIFKFLLYNVLCSVLSHLKKKQLCSTAALNTDGLSEYCSRPAFSTSCVLFVCVCVSYALIYKAYHPSNTPKHK